ncbi:hypothetical protein P8807_19035 [Bacillus subtilis]|uniref:Uncharacterized protein n=1 Tax=Bacillus glycinifermentans TaxID=1664069 RepID=A0A2I7ZJJ4_9BACI|nr:MULTISPECIES: hypothetical protein [Bacillus subtilis group]AUS92798.1 hypothetical protein [Bacillus glycinifermentans]MEC0413622.1 hypothetical protein [Bacillus subtilis]MEC0423282.1 hypothetical protein [Bacillus subtilis]MEC0476034.1 hypothetical protein [Bacillus licheniformis]
MRKRQAFTAVCRSAAAEEEWKPVPIRGLPAFSWPRTGPPWATAQDTRQPPAIDEKTPGIHSPPVEAWRLKKNGSR